MVRILSIDGILGSLFAVLNVGDQLIKTNDLSLFNVSLSKWAQNNVYNSSGKPTEVVLDGLIEEETR